MTVVEPLDANPDDPNNMDELEYWMCLARNNERQVNVLRHLVEDWLPQIGMTIHFRELFYKIVGEPHPDWFDVPPWTTLELQWYNQSLATSARENK